MPTRSTSRLRRAAAALAIAAVLGFGMLASHPALALKLDVSHFTLKNGLEVVVVPDRRAPVVTHMVWYRVGSADEPQGKSGIAHFLEHLMFKGTDEVPSGEFSRIIRKNGGEDNAFTSEDFTAYYQRIAKDRLELVMKLEADRMGHLTLTDEEVIPELSVVQEERRQRTDNDPASLIAEQMDAALYLAHPYGRPVIGWMSEVEKLTKEDAMAFYRLNYTPKNAILVVAGDVNADEVKALAEKYYGVLPNTADLPKRVRTSEPPQIASRRVELTDSRASSPQVRRSYLAPSYTTAEKGQAEALEVLSELLGGGSTSRLNRSLVIGKKVAAQAGSYYGGDGLDGGKFSVYAVPNPGQSPEAVEREINSVLADILTDGVTTAEVERAKRKLLADAVYALDSQFQLAYIFGVAMTSGLKVEDVTEWTDRVQKVGVEDVKRAAAKVFDKRASVTGILLDKSDPALRN